MLSADAQVDSWVYLGIIMASSETSKSCCQRALFLEKSSGR